MNISEILNDIKPLYKKAIEEAKIYNDNLIKPIGSLGKLEELAIQFSGITGNIFNSMDKKAIVIMCADNGVYYEGVSTSPREVTKIQTINFLKGVTGVAVLAKQGNIDLKVIDIGIDADINEEGIINEKIAYGTKNCAKGEAMTVEQFEKAFMIGFNIVGKLKEEGYNIIGTGEMGISNTTTSEAVISVLCNENPENIVGKGAGLTEEGRNHKVNVVKKIIDVNNPNTENPMEVVQKVGGFDIAGLMGVFVGGAYFRVPIVIDGVISMAAALAAYKLCPITKDFMLPSHISAEKGFTVASNEIGVKPIFDIGMRLGEGSGCPFAMYVAESAVKIVNEMITFDDTEIDKSKYIDIREE